MANSPVPAIVNTDSGPHLELTETHRTACSLARRLRESLTRAVPIDPATIRKHAIMIGNALQRIAKAERDCGRCPEHRHIFVKPSAEMLEHHRLAFLDFERLCCELENNPSPRCDDVAAFARKIEHHIEAAETSHQASIRRATAEAS